MPRMSVRIYDVRWNEILPNNWPAPEQVFICKNSVNMLHFPPWVVSRMGKPGEDLTRYGLFWLKDMAVMFAEDINEELV